MNLTVQLTLVLVATSSAASPAILAYELMSEPFIRSEDDGQWYFGELGGY